MIHTCKPWHAITVPHIHSHAYHFIFISFFYQFLLYFWNVTSSRGYCLSVNFIVEEIVILMLLLSVRLSLSVRERVNMGFWGSSPSVLTIFVNLLGFFEKIFKTPKKFEVNYSGCTPICKQTQTLKSLQKVIKYASTFKIPSTSIRLLWESL